MMPASFVYGRITLDFALGGRPARVTVKYRYYAQDKRVEYESIQCDDEKLREKIESDPAMREKINGYVAKALERRNEGLS
ncbi:hypothetical protein [Nitrososphaera sp.]|uniref:hypothetical protein n=1 Tax=Nitrososphaera sp. TaxID=1971748 RepID=UPI00316FB682